jgi:hypothetical protein
MEGHEVKAALEAIRLHIESCSSSPREQTAETIAGHRRKSRVRSTGWEDTNLEWLRIGQSVEVVRRPTLSPLEDLHRF